MLTYKSGESAFIESNWLTPYKTRTLTVTGSEAIMKTGLYHAGLMD